MSELKATLFPLSHCAWGLIFYWNWGMKSQEKCQVLTNPNPAPHSSLTLTLTWEWYVKEPSSGCDWVFLCWDCRFSLNYWTGRTALKMTFRSPILARLTAKENSGQKRLRSEHRSAAWPLFVSLWLLLCDSWVSQHANGITLCTLPWGVQCMILFSKCFCINGEK